MRLDGKINVEIKINDVWTDYTDNLLNAQITRGIQSAYQGPWQQPDAGILSISSRNVNLDPYVNSNIRMNRDIRIKATNIVIFTGRINTINVDYQPKGEPQITTITAVDMIGTMALHTLRDTFKKLNNPMSLYYFYAKLYEKGLNPNAADAEINGITFDYINSGSESDAYNAADGITALQMATTLAQGNLDFFYATKDNVVRILPQLDYYKNNAVKLQFDSNGGATNYRQINLTDGFDLLKNKLSFTSYGTIIPTYTNNYSVNQWGAQAGLIDTYWLGTTTQTSTTNAIATSIFEQTANPTREIASITFDGEAAVDSVADIDILDNIAVHHAVDGLEIQRNYGVIGITHRITNDDWEITYNLRNMNTYNTVFPTPIVAVSPASGTFDETYNFSISNIGSIASENATYVWKDNDLTFSTSATPSKTYFYAEVGAHNITCTVTDSYGFTKTSAAYVLNIYGAAPSGVSFTHTANPADTSIIQFNATATNATSYSWNFGDGTTGTGQSLAHKYDASGSKTVVLTASNAYGSTTSTQTFSVTVPPPSADQLGTWGVRYIKIGIDQYNASGNYYGTLKNFRATTSATNTNRAATNVLEWTLPFQNSGEPYGQHSWLLYNGSPSGLPTVGSCTSTKLRNLATDGLQPYNSISGTANWSLIINLQGTYYDIKTIGISKSGGSSTQFHPLNVYITDYTGDGIANGTVSPLSVTWTKIGTYDTWLSQWNPIVTMPPNLP